VLLLVPATSRQRLDWTPTTVTFSLPPPGGVPPGPAFAITAWAPAGQFPLETVTLPLTTLPRSPLVMFVLPLVDQLLVTVQLPMFSPPQ
jgi:hypothetical protein